MRSILALFPFPTRGASKLSTDADAEQSLSISRMQSRVVHMTAEASVTDNRNVLVRVVRSLASSLPIRFLGDFWFSPRATWRRYSKRRTWPTSDELDQMAPPQFEAYMRSLNMVAMPVDAEGDVDAGSSDLLSGVQASENSTRRPGEASLGGDRGRHRAGPRAGATSPIDR